MESVRIDKWLWAARFFKTRPLAARACALGRIELHGMDAKASREVRVGDAVRIRNDAGEFAVEVLALSDVRGPAPVAQALYRETAASKTAREQQAEERRAMAKVEMLPAGRPSKRNRRELARVRGRG